MQNSDINRRFSDWLLNPRETLDFEVKGWLNLDDQEHRALVAKALIALENHGGGHLLIGYAADAEGRLAPDLKRPASLKGFDEDTIHDILKRYAEPRFQVGVSLQVHPQTGEEFPLVTVHGTTPVPVRTGSASPSRAVPQNIYFIRRPGPESNGPQNGSEWDALIRRCVQRQRQEIVAMLREFSDPTLLVAGPTEGDVHRKRIEAAVARWRGLVYELPEDAVGRLSLGYYYMAASIMGTSKGLPLADVRNINARATSPSHWHVFGEGVDAATRTLPFDGNVETWMAKAAGADASVAGFWRISPEGFFFSLRGYADDGILALRGTVPGRQFNIEANIWQVAEFVMRVREVAEAMYESDFQVRIDCHWTGLTGRRLSSHGRRIFTPGGAIATQDAVSTFGQFSKAALSDLVPDVVKKLMEPLFTSFSFAPIPDQLYGQEVKELVERG